MEGKCGCGKIAEERFCIVRCFNFRAWCDGLMSGVMKSDQIHRGQKRSCTSNLKIWDFVSWAQDWWMRSKIEVIRIGVGLRTLGYESMSPHFATEVKTILKSQSSRFNERNNTCTPTQFHIQIITRNDVTITFLATEKVRSVSCVWFILIISTSSHQFAWGLGSFAYR